MSSGIIRPTANRRKPDKDWSKFPILRQGGSGSSPSNDPLAGLLAYWPVEETGAGARTDQSGNGRHLTANTSIPNNDGILGSCIDFTGSPNYLQYNADGTFNRGANQFEYWCWVFLDTLTANRPVIYYGGVTNKSYMLEFDGSNFTFWVSTDGTTFGFNVTSGVAIATGTWYFIRFYHNPVGKIIAISVNQEAVQTASYTGSVNTTGTMSLQVGNRTDAAAQLDGRVDAIAARDQIVSVVAADIAYNSGQGFEHPWNTAAGAHNPPYSLLLKETFDAAGYDNAGWTEFLGGGTINEDYTGVILDGTQSLRIITNTTTTWVERTITGANFVFCYFQFRIVAHDGIKSIIEAQSSVSARQGWVEILSDLSFRVNAGASSLGSINSLPTNTLLHCWFSYHNNLGGSRKTTFEFSTDGRRLGSGDNYREITAASSATQVGILALGVPSTDFGVDVEYIFDYFLYDNTQIKDKP